MKIWLIAILAGVVIQCGYVYAKTNSVLPKSIEPISLYGEELFSLLAVRKSDVFQLNVPDGVVSVDAPLYPTNHWNPAVVEQVRVLNTLTGKINNVQIKAQNKESVLTENGTIEATRYAYSGDLETEVWYDDAGRWVKMRFKARDGSTINYVCRRCQGPSDPQAPK